MGKYNLPIDEGKYFYKYCNSMNHSFQAQLIALQWIWNWIIVFFINQNLQNVCYNYDDGLNMVIWFINMAQDSTYLVCFNAAYVKTYSPKLLILFVHEWADMRLQHERRVRVMGEQNCVCDEQALENHFFLINVHAWTNFHSSFKSW